ncbi:hypothetical protein [Nioella sp. MMSF_3534]|uniref:hypothetical protein n=1 Tax=Nioella sp. MMSF_3534 TaxID=3046720 RepID=UPI00273FB374|nr:hypothetical protein [Nioella sp. MMSF_3534]
MTNTTDQLRETCRAFVHDLEAPSKTSQRDMIDNALDLEFTINSRGDFLGARILVAFGGPNIWIDTRFDRVEGFWGDDRVDQSYHDENNVHEYCEDLLNCVR